MRSYPYNFAEEKSADSDSRDLLIQLAMEAGVKTKQKDHKEAIINTLRSTDPRRVYDAPIKGVLWGWEVSAYVWTKAISAGLFLMVFLSKQFEWANFSQEQDKKALWASMGFLLVTIILLVKDLDQPKRFLYVLLRPQWTSWLVKGAYGLVGFGGILSLLLVKQYLNLNISF